MRMTRVPRRQFLFLMGQGATAFALAAVAGGAQAEAYVDFFRWVNVDNARGVRQLLERGFDPNARSEQGQCGLYLAIRDESPQVAALLLEWPGTDLNARNGVGETPLMIAALKGDVGMMKALLDKGVPPHHDGWSPLHYAATGKSVEAVRLLLERGVPVDVLSANGTTPLMMAARYGAEGSVELLAARGAKLDHRNEAGKDASDFALMGDREWMARTLRRLQLQTR